MPEFSIFIGFLKHTLYKHVNQPEAQHVEGRVLRVAVHGAGREPGCWEPPHAIPPLGMVPILQRAPCGYRGLWPRIALFRAGLQPYSVHVWCCMAVSSQLFHFRVESVLTSQPQPKTNINPAPLLPSPCTLLLVLLLASHHVTKGKTSMLQH